MKFIASEFDMNPTSGDWEFFDSMLSYLSEIHATWDMAFFVAVKTEERSFVLVDYEYAGATHAHFTDDIDGPDGLGYELGIFHRWDNVKEEYAPTPKHYVNLLEIQAFGVMDDEDIDTFFPEEEYSRELFA